MTPPPDGNLGSEELFSADAVSAAYDTVAEDYEAAFGEDLAHLPLDRAMLEAAAATVPRGGWALDVGCGTGTTSAFVAGHGVPVVGVDLSFGMLAVARSVGRPPVVQGDMRHLPVGDDSCSLVVAFYSIQHVPRPEVGDALGEMVRVLRPDGALLLVTHLGLGDVRIEELLGHRITPVAGVLYSSEEITGLIVGAGLVLQSREQRGPLDHEYPSQRVDLLARRPS